MARVFLEALGEAGIIRKGDFVRRVIIDADINNALIVYVERYGDARLLDLVHTLDGIEIRESDSGSSDAAPLA